MFNALDPKIRKRLQRRYAELQIDQASFIRRFDLNNDGVLDDNEKQAALSTLAHELLQEEAMSSTLNDTEIAIGTTLNERYLILSQIGNGAQGIAYAARDIPNEQRIVVVKQLRLSHMDTWDIYDSFRREAEVLARLSHPRLPRFIETFKIEQNSKHFYFSVQSLMFGTNLADRLEGGEFFTEESLVSIASQCLEILNYLHLNQPSILHRDIKPSNMLLDQFGNLSLVDFGAVQYASASKTMAVGTAGYMPAEQLIGNAQPQSDLYSLGATLIRLATRIHPHELKLNRMRLVWRPHASLSPGFSDWIDKLIDPEIEDRFLNAKTAKLFLDTNRSVFVRREEEIDPLLSLKLIELSEGKPSGSEVRIWESVDQFVCTFPKNKEAVSRVFAVFSEIMNTLFPNKHYQTLSRNGGGFGFDAKAVCGVTVREPGRDKQLLNKKLIHVSRKKFDDGSSGIAGIYKVSTGKSSTKDVHVVLAVGLDVHELEWVWKRLNIFLLSHQHQIT